MWGTSLPGPLPIVGTVGRYPAVYLMGRMSISDRVATFNVRPCEQTCYGILISLSEGYPPVGARLHTRYAPVRRSPSTYCYVTLPLDLHVLGLSLAFILSQDQTLRCMIDFVYFVFRASLGRASLHMTLSCSLGAIFSVFSMFVVLLRQAQNRVQI